MLTIFRNEKFGRPRLIAGALLLAFLIQCGMLVNHQAKAGSVGREEAARISKGLRLWGRAEGMQPVEELRSVEDTRWEDSPTSPEGSDSYHSALHFLIAAAPLAIFPPSFSNSMSHWIWLARVPYLIFGALLGASLWYVSHRLYGNTGGYVALGLYCFCPAMIRTSAVWNTQPEMGAAWGAFGAIFTAIAVSHTLYAPREVVLWNWRRIVLLGVSLSLAVGSQYSLIVIVPVVLGFLIYLAPERRLAALTIWAAACVMGAALLAASYGFRPGLIGQAMSQARFFEFSVRALGMTGNYRRLLAEIGQACPALLLGVPAALLTFLLWSRARYFGNTAPLMMAGLFLLLGLADPHYPGLGFRLTAIPFLFLFVAGVLSDLAETSYKGLVLGSAWGLLGAYAAWNLMELARVLST